MKAQGLGPGRQHLVAQRSERPHGHARVQLRQGGAAHLSRTAAREWAPTGVVRQRDLPGGPHGVVSCGEKIYPGMLAAAAAENPMRRMGDPEADIAPVALFLASDLCSISHRQHAVRRRRQPHQRLELGARAPRLTVASRSVSPPSRSPGRVLGGVAIVRGCRHGATRSDLDVGGGDHRGRMWRGLGARRLGSATTAGDGGGASTTASTTADGASSDDAVTLDTVLASNVVELESADDPGPAPFTSNVGKAVGVTIVSSTVRSGAVKGSEPGLYSAKRGVAACDSGKLVSDLEADPKARRGVRCAAGRRSGRDSEVRRHHDRRRAPVRHLRDRPRAHRGKGRRSRRRARRPGRPSSSTTWESPGCGARAAARS